MLFRCPQSQANNVLLSPRGAAPRPSPPRLLTPTLPSPHFTSPPTGSAPLPFFFVVGSCDRGIPSLLTPLMGWWCAQMKTMYFFFSNGSAELPQFPANCGSHIEVKLFRVTARRWQPPMLLLLLRLLLHQAARRHCAPFYLPQAFSLTLCPLSCPTKPLLWL